MSATAEPKVRSVISRAAEYGISADEIRVRVYADIEETEDGCWLYTKGERDWDYGQFCFKGETYVVHRITYELEYGPIPAGLLVLHKCDVPPCARPDHLFLGTYKDNAQDMVKKGRNRNGYSPGGHLALLRDDPRAYWGEKFYDFLVEIGRIKPAA